MRKNMNNERQSVSLSVSPKIYFWGFKNQKLKIFKSMQNKPNSTSERQATKICKTNPISNSERRATRDERRINMQNEPNYIPAKAPNPLPYMFQKMQKNAKKCKEMQRNAKEIHKKRVLFFTFLNFQTKTHLTPCTTKTYTNIQTQIPLKRGVYLPFLCREKMQNEPNFPNASFAGLNRRETSDEICKTNLISSSTSERQAPRDERRKYAKQTQLQPIHPKNITLSSTNSLIHSFTHLLIHPSTQLCKTNPICNKTNISPSATASYTNYQSSIINNQFKRLSNLRPIFYNFKNFG
jgi:hypothetical protein